MEQRQGRKWLPEEERLRDAHLGGVPIAILAERHLRSRQAIRKRLIRLGLLDPENTPQSTNSTSDSVESSKAVCAWTYLLISERGEVYLGATNHLRRRLRSHNSLESTQWTRGQRWHLLTVRGFASRVVMAVLTVRAAARRAWSMT
jgi:hypothetical protein